MYNLGTAELEVQEMQRIRSINMSASEKLFYTLFLTESFHSYLASNYNFTFCFTLGAWKSEGHQYQRHWQNTFRN